MVRIGTRASDLALRQAGIVQAAFRSQGVECEIVKIKTLGDRKLDQPLAAIGGKGLFTKELEQALLKRKVDVCVHSLKDLPTSSERGLIVAALLEREDPRDVLVVGEQTTAESLAELPPGSRVGTSSLRRRSLLLNQRPDLDVAELRGNVPTRIRKVDDGRVHAAILAAAGIHRLDAHQRIRCYLEPPNWLPAPGQGVIAVQCREDDSDVRELAESMHHQDSAAAAVAERSFLESMDGGCQVPIGALLMSGSAGRVLHGFIGDERGETLVRGELLLDDSDPGRTGRALAALVRSRGGEALVRGLRQLRDVPAPQPE
jgi:hydroxymethylbilane synthase